MLTINVYGHVIACTITQAHCMPSFAKINGSTHIPVLPERSSSGELRFLI